MYFRISGNMNQVINNPPTKKPATAIREDRLNMLRPVMAWPDVHPPPYLVPKPTKNPPDITMNIAVGDEMFVQLNISFGTKP